MSRLTPVLLVCALGLATGSSLIAATDSERDQQALAVEQLVQLGMRLPAQNQIDAFKAAGYADDGHWIEKVLREAFLLRFLTEMPVIGAPLPATPGTPAAPGDPARQTVDPRLEKELKDLTAVLDAATRSKTLPAFAKTLRGGGGNNLQRLANELGAFINPNLPKPQVELAPEKRQSATNLAEVLSKTLMEEFRNSLDKVTAHKADEEGMWNLNAQNPLFKKIFTEACDLRIGALSNAYLGVIVLREVSLRGKEFGIEPAQTAAQAFLKAFLGEHVETIVQWDFELGEFTPFIRAYANVLLGEAVRFDVKGANENDVESGLQSVIDFDTRPLQGDKTSMLEAYHLKLRVWCDLLRWRLELGTARSVTKGLNAWNDFLNRAKNDALLCMPGPPHLAAEIGQLYILAARLFHAKGDNTAANALLGQLIAQRLLNPLSENARRWLSDFSQVVAGGSWGSAPLAYDPSTAITLAHAYLTEAAATADPARQRTNFLDAAVTLRNAVLALGNSPDDTIVDFGPAIYDLYASTLNRLGMSQHAAIVSLEGARVFADYMEAKAQARKPNPWLKNGTKDQWRDDIITPRRLGMDACSYADRLGRIDKTAGRLSDDADNQLTRICPSYVLPPQKLAEVYLSLERDDFPNALKKTRDFITEFPADNLKGCQLLIQIIQRWVDKVALDAGNPETIRGIQDEAAKDIEMVLAVLDAEEAKAPAAERQKFISSTRNAVLSAQLGIMLVSGKYTEVMDQVTRTIDTAPPSDTFLAARMLKIACCAAADYNKEASAGDQGKDIVALQANWKRYSEIYRCVQKMLPSLRNQKVDGDLRAGSQYLAGVMVGVSRQVSALKGGSAPLGSMGADADRAFAELYEPWIDDRTPADNIIYCANKLWEVDAKERATRLYLRYQATLDNDKEVQNFIKEPKPLLDRYGEAVHVRAEFKKPWDRIVDLSYNPPDRLKLNNGDVPTETMTPGVHADYPEALAAIAAFRTKNLAAQKPVMAPEQYKAIETALNGLERLLGALANNLMVHHRLAQFYRETGQFDMALDHLTFIYAFDTHDPEAQIGIIDATRRKMIKGQASRTEISTARDLAAGLRENFRGSNKLGYWEAEIQVMEFSLGLVDTKEVNDTLAFMHRNRSDLSRDLVAPRIDGDDKRVRRALNAQAVELAKRFLELYATTGVSVKREFRIDLIDAGGTSRAIFTDVDAPTFVARTIPAKDVGDALVIVPADSPLTVPANPAAPQAPHSHDPTP